MIIHEDFYNLFRYPVRYVSAQVELYNGSTLIETYNQYYKLRELTIERVAEEGKFFGFGICQRLNVHLEDMQRWLDISTANSMKVGFSVGATPFIGPCPLFYVSEIHRDEKTNELSITAYDAIYKATAHTVDELELVTPYTMEDVLSLICGLLGLNSLEIPEVSAFREVYESGANLDGTETIREVLNAIAEATQTIYYINGEQNLVFKRLDKDGAALLEIGKDDYIDLDSGANRRLTAITHTTELGNNVVVSLEESGTNQFIRDNPFWDLRTDIDTLLNNALANIGGLTINQFSCSWRGNPLLEIGDKIALITKDDKIVYSYLLDDVISYDGAYSQKTKWEYSADDADTPANPANLGDALRQTYAKVDKVNKQIDIVASETGANTEAIAALRINTDSINATIVSVEEAQAAAIDGIYSDMATLTSRVDATMSAEDVVIAIQSELANGVDKVTTSTGFTFNEAGLTVSKSDSEITTTISQDGMKVYKNNEAVLIADNEGVKAEDLHATTYLIIGNNSRLEDYGERTACFWIGG